MANNKEKLRAAAQKYLQKGQIEKAIREYEHLVEEDPKDVRTLSKLGDLQKRAGMNEAATKTYGRVATFYVEQGFFLRAVATYKLILTIDANLVDINTKLAELYQQLGLMSDAVGQYRHLAQLLEHEGKLDESIQVIKKLVDLDGENVAARIKLAEIYAKQSRHNEAKAEFHKAAEQLKLAGRLEDWAKVAERIVFFEPNDLDTVRELADVYIQKGDARRALAKLQVCFKANPRDINTLQLLASAFRDLGQVQKAASVYKELARLYKDGNDAAQVSAIALKILELVPNDPDAQALLSGQSLAPAPVKAAKPASTGRPVATVETVETDDSDVPPVSTGPSNADDPEQLQAEADTYLKFQLHEKARVALARILELDPTRREARTKYKDLMIALGENDVAIEHLQILAEESVALVLPEQARAELRELLDLDPDNALGQQLLASLPQPTMEISDDSDILSAGDEILGAPDEEGGLDIDVSMDDVPDAAAVGELILDVDTEPHEAVPGASSEEESVVIDVATDAPPEDDSFDVDMGSADDFGTEPTMEIDASELRKAALALTQETAPAEAEESEGPSVEIELEVEAPAVAASAPEISLEIEPEPVAPPKVESKPLVADKPKPAPSPTPPVAAKAPVATPSVELELESDPVSEPPVVPAKPAPAAAAPVPTPTPSPAASAPKPQKAPAAPRSLGLDLDALLASALPVKSATKPAAPAQTTPAPAAAPVAATPVPAAVVAPAAPSKTASSFADLDALVASASVPKAKPTPPAPAPVVASAPTPTPAAPAPAVVAQAPVAQAPVVEPEPPTSPTDEELEEISFFREQGLLDEAKDALTGLLDRFPGHPALLALKVEVEDSRIEPEAEAFSPPATLATPAAPPEPEVSDSIDDIPSDDAPQAQLSVDEAAPAPVAVSPSPSEDVGANASALLPAVDPAYEPESSEPPSIEDQAMLEAEAPADLFDAAPPAPVVAEEEPPAEPGVESAVESAVEPPAVSAAPAAAPAVVVDESVHLENLAEELDLAAEASADMDAGAEDLQVSFNDVFDEFKKGVAAQVDEGDYETHFNLGIAYREMGLFQDAIHEFELSEKSPQRQIVSLTMIGLCKLERGDAPAALEYFQRGLNSQFLTPNEAVALRYEVGSAYEGMGRFADAFKFYEKVHALDPNFREVAKRIADLRGKQAEEGFDVDASDELDQLLQETSTETATNSSKISYI